ncbi:hypothetical protein TSAR_015602 [Trichomalopsis sarcophagae]|uniref:A to I editase domain-containing protein n=1 Tax=Trichomalopsis sarcophagae TaxID=543379 RepID=A0A232ELU0_9HYME|nr:hypothetical protein TSAR_015602 [Trichomalopsis sarcophagae]
MKKLIAAKISNNFVKWFSGNKGGLWLDRYYMRRKYTAYYMPLVYNILMIHKHTYIYFFDNSIIENIFINLSGQPEAEIINCTTGKDELGKPSRISKQGLFKKFYHLIGKIKAIDDIDETICHNYLDAKTSVQDYSVRVLL